MPSPHPAQRRSVPAPAACALALGAVLLAGNGEALAQKGPSTQSPAPAEMPVLVDENAISFAEGLQPIIDSLSARTDLNDQDMFVLAGAQFLRGVEIAYQTRFRYGVTEGMAAAALMEMGLPVNPDPEPFTGSVIEQLFAEVDQQMAAARGTLALIDVSGDLAVPVDVSSIWLDVDGNGERAPNEDLTDFLTNLLGGRQAEDALTAFLANPVVDFDTSDAAWLTAYTHLISATANVVLALQPADIIDEVFADGAELDALFRGEPGQFLAGEGRTIDTFMAWILALEQTPVVEHTRAARRHLLAMIAENRTFWTRVAAETDQGREWIPSPTQTSALPIEFPGETGPTWLAVLIDLEALLNGELLIPHWRLGGTSATHGINLATFLEEPRSTDLLGLFHGRGVLFAVEEGPIISADNWRVFQQLVGRGRGFFPILLN